MPVARRQVRIESATMVDHHDPENSTWGEIRSILDRNVPRLSTELREKVIAKIREELDGAFPLH
jgi:hypothetical protein